MVSRLDSLLSVVRKNVRLLAALPLAALLLAGAWELLDRVVHQQAVLQAVEGRAEEVAQLRGDWAEVLLPVALSTPGDPGKAARRAINARLDLASSASGDQQLSSVAEDLISGILEHDELPTKDGAEWARNLAERLLAESKRVTPAARLRLVQQIDRTLAMLASKPYRREPIEAQQEPAKQTPKLVSQPVEPKSASEPAPKPVALTTVPTPTAKPVTNFVVSPPREVTVQQQQPEPNAWRPPWQASPVPVAPVESPPLASSKEHARDPVNLSDRELIAELMSTPAAIDQPSASGPRQAPWAAEGAGDERRIALEAELSRRGFANVSRQQASALLSMDAEVRLELAEQLLVSRTGNAARLLMMLAEDESPEVRAAAISALGASANRQLVEFALDRAEQDRDTRVGRLAAALREQLR